MYIEMKDKSYIADWGIEIGQLKNNMVYLFIPDELVNMLSKTFIRKLKLVYKNMKYIGIKEFKRLNKNKYSTQLEYKNIIHQPYNEDILYIKYEKSYKLVREWENDIKIIEEYYNKNS